MTCGCCNRSTRAHRHIIARGLPDSGNQRLVRTIYQLSTGGFVVEGHDLYDTLGDLTPAQYAARHPNLGWKWSNDIHAMQFLQLSKDQHNG